MIAYRAEFDENARKTPRHTAAKSTKVNKTNGGRTSTERTPTLFLVFGFSFPSKTRFEMSVLRRANGSLSARVRSVRYDWG